MKSHPSVTRYKLKLGVLSAIPSFDDLAVEESDIAVIETGQQLSEPALHPASGASARQFHVKSLGFESFDELLAKSRPVRSNDGKVWHLTELEDGSWAAWNEMDLHAERHYASLDEATASVPRNVELTGSSLLG